jgi:hypothetical protein
MKVRKPPQSGSLGDIIAKRNRFGQYETRKPTKKYRHTAARRRVCLDLGRVSRLWNQITEEQREGWRRRAAEVLSRPRLGVSGRLTGQNLFVKINTVLATCGYDPVMDAPPLPNLDRNPVVGLTITHGEQGPVLKLRLAPRSKQDLMVFGSPPRNAGRLFCAEFEFLDMVQASADGEADITRAYTWKHGAPRPGSRVFIRTWPQENGWEARALARVCSAIVPAKPRPAHRPKRS